MKGHLQLARPSWQVARGRQAVTQVSPVTPALPQSVKASGLMKAASSPSLLQKAPVWEMGEIRQGTVPTVFRPISKRGLSCAGIHGDVLKQARVKDRHAASPACRSTGETR